MPSGDTLLLNRVFHQIEVICSKSAVRIGSVLLLVGLLAFQLFDSGKGALTFEAFVSRIGATPVWLILAIGLMPVNWLLETLKWKYLQDKHEAIPLGKAFMGVLAGVALSIFMPARIGEYGGRLTAVKSGSRTHTIISTMMGSFSQVTVIVIAGALSAIGLVYTGHASIDKIPLSQPWLYVICVSLIIMSLTAYFQTHRIGRLLTRTRLLKPYTEGIVSLTASPSSVLMKLLLFSGLRLMVFTAQYYCMLLYFGAGVPVVEAGAVISLLFLVQTLLPLMPLTGLALRGNIAVLIWGAVSVNEFTAIAATYSLYILNVVIPAVAGLISLVPRGK